MLSRGVKAAAIVKAPSIGLLVVNVTVIPAASAGTIVPVTDAMVSSHQPGSFNNSGFSHTSCWYSGLGKR